MALHGNNILIYKDGQAIAGTVSDKIQALADLIEKSSPTSGEWKEYETERKSWNVNVNYLVMASTGLWDLLEVGSTFTLRTRSRGNPWIGVQGTAILKACDITATEGNLVHGSFQFQGTSELLAVGGGN